VEHRRRISPVEQWRRSVASSLAQIFELEEEGTRWSERVGAAGIAQAALR
jgi:hypothetical protein